MDEMLRIWRSPKSDFGPFLAFPDAWREETVTALDAYDDAELAAIAESGFNAIWMHGNLNSVARSGVFPELGRDAELHQERMNALIERAGRHGLKVFMYCQPPRAIGVDDAFWERNLDVAGQIESAVDADGKKLRLRSLCVSTKKVMEHLRLGAKSLAENVPGLGGLILITASEYPAHCWSRRGRVINEDGSVSKAEIDCPRCGRRSPAELVAEIIRLVRDGVRAASRDWRIIVWNWSWTIYAEAPCAEIIDALPDDVVLMADFERGGVKAIAGKERAIDEYSLSYAGPSRQFMNSLDAAKRRGLQVMAKLQFGATHELATVPNIPVIGNVFAKASAVRRLGLAGFMGCWNFGNMRSVNSAAFNAFLSGRLPDGRDTALRAFAAEHFPGSDADGVREAWLKFGEAMDSYPFSIPFLYRGPMNFSFILPLEPGPLSGKPLGRSWLLDERGDDMSDALGCYTVEEIIDCLERMAQAWGEGLQRLRGALAYCVHPHAQEELDVAAVCWHSFRSASVFAQAYRMRKSWDDSMLPDYWRLAAKELDNLKELLPMLERDIRFGYHIEAHGYQYDSSSVSRKVKSLEAQLLEAGSH